MPTSSLLQKEKEKEELRELRAQEREERKLAQEIAAARKKLEKERKQYLAAYRDASKRLGAAASEKERADLQEKVDEFSERKLDDVDVAVKDVDYREANQKAGFVYIISNVGSFGEGGVQDRHDAEARADGKDPRARRCVRFSPSTSTFTR